MRSRGQTQGVRIVIGIVVAVIALFIIMSLGGKLVGLLFKAPANVELAARNSFTVLSSELKRMDHENVKQSTIIMGIPDDFFVAGFNKETVVDGVTCGCDEDFVRPSQCKGEDCICLFSGGGHPGDTDPLKCLVNNGWQFLVRHPDVKGGNFDDGPNYGNSRKVKVPDNEAYEWLAYYGDCQGFEEPQCLEGGADEEFFVQNLKIERIVKNGVTYFVFSTPDYVAP